MPVTGRTWRRGPRRLRPREFRESILKLENERFCGCVAGVIRRAPKKTGGIVKKIAIDLLRAVIRLTPVVTGRARAGWLPFLNRYGYGGGRGSRIPYEGKREGEYRAKLRGRKPFVVLTNSVPYICALEFGARPHVIEPRAARALRFVAGGRVVFARRVMHPGIRPYRSLRRAMRHVRRGLATAFGPMLEEAA